MVLLKAKDVLKELCSHYIVEDDIKIKCWSNEEYLDIKISNNKELNYCFNTFKDIKYEMDLPLDVHDYIEINHLLYDIDTYTLWITINLKKYYETVSFNINFISKEIEYEFDNSDIQLNDIDLEENCIFLEKVFTIELSLNTMIKDSIKEIEYHMSCVEMRCSSFIWRKEYEQDEKLFSKEIVSPLLKNMGFYSVIYHHGINEFGKDFILTQQNPFGYYEYIGVQVKVGNLDGKANSKIDEIIAQIDDCFEIPYLDIKTKEYKLISSFILI